MVTQAKMALPSRGPSIDFELELPPSGKSSASETDSDEFFDAEDSTPKSRSVLSETPL